MDRLLVRYGYPPGTMPDRDMMKDIFTAALLKQNARYPLVQCEPYWCGGELQTQQRDIPADHICGNCDSLKLSGWCMVCDDVTLTPWDSL